MLIGPTNLALFRLPTLRVPPADLPIPPFLHDVTGRIDSGLAIWDESIVLLPRSEVSWTLWGFTDACAIAYRAVLTSW